MIAPVSQNIPSDQVELLRVHQLSEEQITLWKKLQAGHPEFESPYFHPGFTQAVAAVRDDVEVAVLKNRFGEAIGFFPFQRNRSNIGFPVGGRFSDFHGVLLESDESLDVKNLIQQCGLKAWNFDHLIASQRCFQDYHFRRDESPYLDLSEGFEAYKQKRRAAGSTRIKQTLRKGRKLAKDVGELRIVPQTSNPEVLEQLLTWKSEQYRQSGLVDLFSYDWTRALLYEILTKSDDEFRGLLSVLYAGDQIVAIDFGLRSRNVLHSWFPAYNPDFRRYSPGHLLLIKLAEASQQLGIDRIHLGKGEESYKSSFASDVLWVAEGTIDRNPFNRFVKQQWSRTRDLLKQSPLRTLVRRPVRFFRRLKDRVSFS
ncbi:MAG: GNAT family N-acetyltransferase [Planctomycetaceae bacterium]